MRITADDRKLWKRVIDVGTKKQITTFFKIVIAAQEDPEYRRKINYVQGAQSVAGMCDWAASGYSIRVLSKLHERVGYTCQHE